LKSILITSSIFLLISINGIQSFADDYNTIFDLEKNVKIMIDESNFENALINLNKILIIEPNNTNALNNKGNILLKMGNYTEAIPIYDTLLKFNENNTEALNNKGIALYHQELYAQSLLSFHKSLLVDPFNEVTFNNTQNVVKQLYFLDASTNGYAIIYTIDKHQNIVTYSRATSISIQPPLGYVYFDEAGSTKEIEVGDRTVKVLQFTGSQLFDRTQYVGRADIYGQVGNFPIKISELILNGILVNSGDTLVWEITIFNPPFLDS